MINSKFDIILINGRRRVDFAKKSINYLKNDGIVIWDNSLRERYHEGVEFLHKNDF